MKEPGNVTAQSVPSPDGLKPSDHFARLANTVFGVTKEQLAAQEARSAAESTRKKPGPPKGTPNWKTKRKIDAEKTAN